MKIRVDRQCLISGIAFNRDEAKITIQGVPDRPGIAYQILGPVGEANIDVDMIVQNVGHDGLTDFSFTVHRNDYQKALKVLKPVVEHTKARGLQSGDKIAKGDVVADGARGEVDTGLSLPPQLASSRAVTAIEAARTAVRQGPETQLDTGRSSGCANHYGPPD